MDQLIKMINYPIYNINFKENFENLTDEEKMYAYYLSEACISGSPIILFQVSFESPALFIIFQTFFCSFKPFNTMKSQILLKSNGNITDIEYKQFIRYAAKFYSNFGNYNIFKKKKFIPELSVNKFELILSLSEDSFKKTKFIWNNIKSIIYDNRPNFNNINLEEKKGKNYYYLFGINEAQIKKIDNQLLQKGYSPINTRLMTLSNNKYAVMISSIQDKKVIIDDEVTLIYGEFSSFLNKVNQNLELAKKYVSNDNEIVIIDALIKSINTGDIKDYTEAQKLWINNITSNIEMHIGWDEKHIDPLHIRGTYEGWVTISDKEESEKLNEIIETGISIISALPWNEDLNNVLDIPTQSLSLDILSFSTNYIFNHYNFHINKELDDNDAIKTTFFNNQVIEYQSAGYSMSSESDNDIIKKYSNLAFKIKAATSCIVKRIKPKLLKKSENGDFLFDYEKVLNIIKKDKLNNIYNHIDTYESKFGELYEIIELLRENIYYLYIIFNKNLQDLLSLDDNEINDLIYTIWLTMIKDAILNLSLYDITDKQWKQNTIQSEWIIINFIMSEQTEGAELINIEIVKDNKIKVTIKKEMVLCYAQMPIEQLLLKLQSWISTGDIDEANCFINKYSQLNSNLLNIRKVIVDNEPIQALKLFNNLKLHTNTNGEVVVKVLEYPESFEGIVQSFVDRFQINFNKDIFDQWIKYDINIFN